MVAVVTRPGMLSRCLDVGDGTGLSEEPTVSDRRCMKKEIRSASDVSDNSVKLESSQPVLRIRDGFLSALKEVDVEVIALLRYNWQACVRIN
jgi:hypothetical protein